MPPHHGFLIAAGLAETAEAIRSEAPSADDVRLLRPLGVLDGDLLAHLAEGPLHLDLDAVDDGTVVFADEPVLTIEGALCDVLLAASVARRVVPRATAVATRTARRVIAADGAPIIDGASARAAGEADAELIARAAYLGGASGTTAALTGARLGIPVRSPTGHRVAGEADDGWGHSATDVLVDLPVIADELDVLTMRAAGVLAGGGVVHDLDAPAWLSCRTDIVSVEQGGSWVAQIGDVGDTSHDPGRKLVVRYLSDAGVPVADVVHWARERIQAAQSATLHGASGALPVRAARSVPIAKSVLRRGERVGSAPSLAELRAAAAAGLHAMPPGVRRLRLPDRYPVGLSPALAAKKVRLLAGEEEDVSLSLGSAPLGPPSNRGTLT